MRYFLLIIINFCSLITFGTGQAGDIIFWNDKKFVLFSNPLESYPQFSLISDILFDDKPGSLNTGCYRGYIAEWKIISNHLYLTNIYAYDDLNKKADLNRLFPGKVNDEAMRVISQIPDFDFYIQRGKVFKRYWLVPVVFSQDKKIKYNKLAGVISISHSKFGATTSIPFLHNAKSSEKIQIAI